MDRIFGTAGSSIPDTSHVTQRYEKLAFRAGEESPLVASLINKLVISNQPREYDQNGNRQISMPAGDQFNGVSDDIARSISDADSTFQLMPDIELCKQILISSILAPKDMVTSEIVFGLSGLSNDTELTAAMLKFLKEYFTDSYKIKQLMPDILSDALFTHGSYSLLTMPESSIDEAINSPNRITSMETMRDSIGVDNKIVSLGILGNRPTTGVAATTFSYESFTKPYEPAAYNPVVSTEELRLSVTDNFNILKLPRLQDKLRQDRLQDILTVKGLTTSTEGSTTATASEVESSVYRRRNHQFNQILRLKTVSESKSGTVGHPLALKVPAEAVIPVHTPGDEKNHIGYFLILDEFGNFVVKARTQDYYAEMTGNYASNVSVSSLLNKAASATNGTAKSSDRETLSAGTRAYTDIVEAELLERLRSGAVGENVALARPTEVYRIMLARALANMQTQMLYVPAEMLTYFAFDYNQYGVGRSMIEASKMIGGIRSLLLFADTMGAVKNSIGRQSVKIALDPTDNDPSGTVEFLMGELAKTRSASFPLGISDPNQLIEHLQNAGIDLVVSGNTAYPETSVDVEDRSSTIVRPDSDLNERLKKDHIASFGLSPENIDAGYNAEFATSIVSSNLLLTKRVLANQAVLCAHMSEHCRTYVRSSSVLMDGLRELVKSGNEADTKPAAVAVESMHRGPGPVPAIELTNDKAVEVAKREKVETPNIEAYILDFLNLFEVSLPSPDTLTLTNQMESFTAYVEGLDEALKAYLDSTYLDPDVLGQTGAELDQLIGATRSYFIRQWLRQNSVFPELDVLTAPGDKDEKAFSLTTAHNEHLDGMANAFKGFSAGLKERRSISTAEAAKFDELLLTKYGEVPEGAEPVETETTDDTSGEDDLGGGGLDDFPAMDEEPVVADDAGLPAEEAEPVVEDTKPDEEPAAEPDPVV